MGDRIEPARQFGVERIGVGVCGRRGDCAAFLFVDHRSDLPA
jgi:hypothetical protein